MNIADEIQRLQQLHESGALTDEEFANAKATVLARAASESHGAGAGTTCYKCGAAPRSVCQLCGHMICDQHGGERWVLVDSSGGKYGNVNTLTKRVICDDCTPDPAMMKRWVTSFKILVIVSLGFILLVFLFILLSFLRF